MSEQYLVHYGVPGMKWGVRKAPERTGRLYRGQKSSGMSDKSKARLKKGAAIAAGIGVAALGGYALAKGGMKLNKKGFARWQHGHQMGSALLKKQAEKEMKTFGTKPAEAYKQAAQFMKVTGSGEGHAKMISSGKKMMKAGSVVSTMALPIGAAGGYATAKTINSRLDKKK